jgi:hypothetical protein
MGEMKYNGGAAMLAAAVYDAPCKVLEYVGPDDEGPNHEHIGSLPRSSQDRALPSASSSTTADTDWIRWFAWYPVKVDGSWRWGRFMEWQLRWGRCIVWRTPAATISGRWRSRRETRLVSHR